MKSNLVRVLAIAAVAEAVMRASQDMARFNRAVSRMNGVIVHNKPKKKASNKMSFNSVKNFKSKLNTKPNSVRKDFNSRKR